MKKKNGAFIYTLLIVIVFSFFILIISSENDDTNRIKTVEILPIKNIYSTNKNVNEIGTYLTFDINDDGYDIYSPNKYGYRYGPSIIYYEDGTMDAWFASNGNSSEWDWITYRHFDGNDWMDEEVVLRPTPNSSDHYSVCDPGVIYFNDYYYLGYTSTENARKGGIENCAYVARSKNPNGPYEKWNGQGWGGKPEPIIVYDEQDSEWGAGELSFVIVDNELYCYYSWDCEDGQQTRLAKAKLEENWPSTLIEEGIVIERKNGQDSVDVIYNDEYDRFIALCIESRFLSNSCVAVYESSDGKSFVQVDTIKTNINKYSHNMGISKKKDGHVDIDDDLLIGYAYSKSSFSSWGRWSTKFVSANLKLEFIK